MHNKGNHKPNEKETHRVGENISNDATDKGLISKIYKQLLQIDIKKMTNPIRKMGRSPKYTVSQRRHTMLANRDMISC